MTDIIIVDGTKIKLVPQDLDRDGKIGGTELVTQKIDHSITDISQPTELGESLKELNDDSLDKNSKMTSIDMRSRLHPIEISSILAVDSLVSFKFLPEHCLGFTRQKKRLAVSMSGLGRKEIVDVIAGKREHDKEKTSMMDKIRNKFGGGGME